MKYIVSFCVWVFPIVLVILILFWLAPETSRELVRGLRSMAGMGDELVEKVAR